MKFKKRQQQKVIYRIQEHGYYYLQTNARNCSRSIKRSKTDSSAVASSEAQSGALSLAVRVKTKVIWSDLKGRKAKFFRRRIGGEWKDVIFLNFPKIIAIVIVGEQQIKFPDFLTVRGLSWESCWGSLISYELLEHLNI